MTVSSPTWIDLGTFGAPPRPVRLYLPAGVDVDRPHPTLYLFDGQNVFDDAGSFAGGWRAHHAVDALPRRVTPPVVVAIGNGGVHRVHELGHAVDRFVDAIADELVPRVEAAVHGRGPRALGGASLGGLGALHGWLHRPDRFDGALVMSPSLWFGDRVLAGQVHRGEVPVPATGRIYVDAGKRERGTMFADAEALAATLADRGLGPDRLMWRPDARGAHQERHWRRRLPKALRFLFGPAPGSAG
ncbi:MAG: alpha/beta hydrolase-fold protein [Myxococcota bacterium]